MIEKPTFEILQWINPMGKILPWADSFCNNQGRNMPPKTTGWIFLKLLQPTQSDIQNFVTNQPNEP